MYTVEEYKQFILESLIRKGIVEKCSKPKYFSMATRSVMDEFASRTKDLDHEQAIVIDDDGNIIYDNDDGKSNQVGIDDRRIAKYVVQPAKWVGGENGHSEQQPNKFNELNIDHNHPTIKGFEAVPPILSPNDIQKMVSTINGGFPFRSITAESNGMRMSLVRQYNPKYLEGDKRDFDFQDTMEKNINTANAHYWSAIAGYVGLYKEKLHEYTNIPKNELKTYFENSTDEQTRTELSSRAVNEIGTLYDYLDKEGVIKEYQNCDIELLIEQ